MSIHSSFRSRTWTCMIYLFKYSERPLLRAHVVSICQNRISILSLTTTLNPIIDLIMNHEAVEIVFSNLNHKLLIYSLAFIFVISIHPPSLISNVLYRYRSSVTSVRLDFMPHFYGRFPKATKRYYSGIHRTLPYATIPYVSRS